MKIPNVKRIINPWHVLVAAAVTFHLFKVFVLFRNIQFDSGFPIVNSDFLLYFARALRTHEFFIRSGRFWGYDPFEMAGYVAGPIHEAGNLLMSLICHAFAGILPIWVSLLSMEFILTLLAPFSIILFAKSIGCSKEQSWLSFFIVNLMYINFNSFTRGTAPHALFGFFIGSFLCVGYVGIFILWENKKNLFFGSLFILSSILLPMFHPMLPLIVVPVIGGIYVSKIRDISFRSHIFIILLVAISFAINWFWIKPTFHFINWKSDVPYLTSPGLSGFLRELSLIKPTLFGLVSNVFQALVCFGAVSNLLKRRLQLGVLAWPFLIWLVSLFIVGYFGSSLPFLHSIQPYRFSCPFWILASILCGFELGFVWSRSKHGQYWIIRVLLIAMGISILSWKMKGDQFLLPYENVLPERQTKLMSYLNDKSEIIMGRVLLECGNNSLPHIADIIPIFTKKIMLGGPNPGVFLKSKFTVFAGYYWDGEKDISDRPIAFGKYLEDVSEEEFQGYLDLYNIQKIYAWSDQSILRLNLFTTILQPSEIIGGFYAYKVIHPSHWFYEGKGVVKFDYDRIELSQCSKGRLILKTHWMKGLVAVPGVPLEPVYLMDDPVPFIQINNSLGAKDIVIVNAGIK